MRDTWVLVVGNPIDGMIIVGPFEEHELACQYGERELQLVDWWATRLQVP